MVVGQIVEPQESKSCKQQDHVAMAPRSAKESQESKSQESQIPIQMASRPDAAEDSLQPACVAFEDQSQFQPMQTIDPCKHNRVHYLMPFPFCRLPVPNFETMQLMQQQMFIQRKFFDSRTYDKIGPRTKNLLSQRVVNGDLAQTL